VGFGVIGRIVICWGGEPTGSDNEDTTGFIVGPADRCDGHGVDCFIVIRVGGCVGCRVGLEVGFGVSSSFFMSKISLMIKRKFARRLSSIRTSSSEHPDAWHPRERIRLTELINESLSSESTIPPSTNFVS